MANYSLNINLLKIDGATLQANPTTGKQAIILPVEDANIFVNQNGTAAYLGINMYESRNNQYDDSHSLKLKYSKEYIDRVGVDVIKQKPFIGNAKEKKPYVQAPAPQPTPQQNVSTDFNW